MRISDWSSDVCSSDLTRATGEKQGIPRHRPIPGIVPERGGGRPADRRASADRRYHQLADRLARRHPRDRLAALRQRKGRSEEHTSELQSLMRISYAVFCLKKKKIKQSQ